jgi:hypothetical protein
VISSDRGSGLELAFRVGILGFGCGYGIKGGGNRLLRLQLVYWEAIGVEGMVSS